MKRIGVTCNKALINSIDKCSLIADYRVTHQNSINLLLT